MFNISGVKLSKEATYLEILEKLIMIQFQVLYIKMFTSRPAFWIACSNFKQRVIISEIYSHFFLYYNALFVIITLERGFLLFSE